LLSLPAGNEMFHFPAFPPLALCVQARVTGHDSSRVSPFGNPRINARLAAPRGLSQPPTSFIGSWCQGIHRAPLLAWPQRCSRPLCSSQGAGGPGRGPVAGHPHRDAVRRANGPPVGKRRTGPVAKSLAGRRFSGAESTKLAARRRQARSLRTQQRARPSQPSPVSFQLPKKPY
jgi:hypothetical protein